MFCDFLHLSDGIERKVKRYQVGLVGSSGSDLEGIGLKEEQVELWISYFTTTLNGWGIRCATFSTKRESNGIYFTLNTSGIAATETGPRFQFLFPALASANNW